MRLKKMGTALSLNTLMIRDSSLERVSPHLGRWGMKGGHAPVQSPETHTLAWTSCFFEIQVLPPAGITFQSFPVMVEAFGPPTSFVST
jgi:hypothetical protein